MELGWPETQAHPAFKVGRGGEDAENLLILTLLSV